MPILDSQVHAYERNHPGRPWVGTLYGPAEVTGDQMVAAMDEVGVDGAVLVSPFSMYRYDASYALEVFAAHPTGSGWSSRSIRPIRESSDTIADWACRQRHGRHPDFPARQRFRPIPPTRRSTVFWPRRRSTRCRSMWRVRAGWTRRDSLRRAIPNTRMVIDHLGLPQPHEPPPPAEPFADLPKLLALAAHRQCRGQNQRRLHAVARALSLQRHLGPARRASSTPLASIAACGAPTGPARSAC